MECHRAAKERSHCSKRSNQYCSLSCWGRQRTGDVSLLPNDNGHQDGMYVVNDIPDDDIHSDVRDSRYQTTA